MYASPPVQLSTVRLPSLSARAGPVTRSGRPVRAAAVFACHDGAVHVSFQRAVTRRVVLGAAGAGALALVTGCNPFSAATETITVTAEPTTTPAQPSPAAPLLGLVFTTRLHVQRLTEAIAADERDAATLSMLLSDRQAHLAALEAEYVRASGQDLPATAPQPGSTSGPASSSDEAATDSQDPDEVIGRIRGDAATAQTMFTDALAGASRFQAQLYASIAACIATHRMVLS